MIENRIDKMTLDEKIGQLVIFGFASETLDQHAINLIKNHKAGNVILFGRNIRNTEQLFKLNQSLQKLAKETLGIPLFISIDQEGGMVTRIKTKATYFPGAMTLGATNDPNNSYLTGKLMGRELKALGINLDLAPDLDINNNPHNPVIGVRSYGDNEKVVSDNGLEMIRGLQESVIATAKHFPGHGDTFVDSHLDLPKIEKSIEELERLELIPFRKAIKNGVKAIMSAHIDFPALTEAGLPTTLSHQCLTGFLRKKLGFTGIIMTDCMEMKAIQTYYTTPKGALMALKAGADMVMVSHTEELQVKTIEFIKNAVLDGSLPMDIIDDRLKRVLQAKQENIDFQIDNSYDDIKVIVENEESRQFALNTVRQALTLIRGKAVDLKKKTLLIAPEALSTTIADEEEGVCSIIKSVIKELPDIYTYQISMKLSDIEKEAILERVEYYEQVVFCSYNANIFRNQLALIKVLEKTTNLHVIAMRNPYDSLFEPSISNLVLLYEYTPNAVKVLIEYLKGEIIPSGVAPVSL